MDVAAYRNWLLAGKPPFQWFAEQDTVTQEGLAKLGAEHAEAERLAGAAVVLEGVERLLVDAIAGIEAAMALPGPGGAQQVPPPVPGRPAHFGSQGAAKPPTIAGIRDRQVEADAAAKADRDKCRSFLGRRPDPEPGVAMLCRTETVHGAPPEVS